MYGKKSNGENYLTTLNIVSMLQMNMKKKDKKMNGLIF